MPVPIPTPFSEHGHIPMSWSSCNSLSSSESSSSSSYPEIIRELASKAPKPYGTIPPRRRKRRRKSILFEDPTTVEQCVPPIRIQRRMSHVEDWIKVDSKEPLPDDDELTSSTSLLSQLFSSSAFQGAHVLPLHVPPPNLSNPTEYLQEESLISHSLYNSTSRPSTHESFAIASSYIWDSSYSPSMLSSDVIETLSENDEVDEFDQAVPMEDVSSVLPWAGEQTKARPVVSLATVTAKRSLNNSRTELLDWLGRLRKSISKPLDTHSPFPATKKIDRSRKWATMPPPPKRSPRRSVANSEPRIDLVSNTVRRDIRANPDHLRMIVAELNMMRARKVMCPLKPRGFLPRRKDVFVRGLSCSSLKYTSVIVEVEVYA